MEDKSIVESKFDWETSIDDQQFDRTGAKDEDIFDMDNAPNAHEAHSSDSSSSSSSSSEENSESEDSDSSDSSNSMTIGYSDPLEFFKKTDDVLTFYIMI